MKKGHVVVCFGRFSPPTLGHEKMFFDLAERVAKSSSEYVIFVSRTQDPETDPLDPEKKVAYLKTIFPFLEFRLTDEAYPSISKYFIELGEIYDSVTMVVGADRVDTFTAMFERANEKFFHFSKWEVVSCGERFDSPEIGSCTISATKMREFVKVGDLNSFLKGLPSIARPADGVRLFEDMMAAMGINTDEPNEGSSSHAGQKVEEQA